MKHTNFYFPYDKGSNYHEDHLSRAFILLLRQSTTVLHYFYSYVVSKSDDGVIPRLHEMSMSDIDFMTQVGKLPEADKYLSVLLTDEPIVINNKIEKAERKAIYDGVIDFNGELVLFIETKPKSGDVRDLQLSPGAADIPAESDLVEKAAVLEWKEIIKFLHLINGSNGTPQQEKNLIDDFLELIETSFSELKPYDKLSLCGDSIYLLEKRVEQILRSIAGADVVVDYHRGWGYYIETNLPEIRKVALLLEKDAHDTWSGVRLVAEFGSTVTQSRMFYNRDGLNKILDIEGVKCRGNLHLAFRGKNLLFFDSPEDSAEKYLEYWKTHDFGGKDKKSDLVNLLNQYIKDGIIIFNDDKKGQQLDSEIMKKRYSKISICPSFSVEYYIPRVDALQKDTKGELVNDLSNKIREILGVMADSATLNKIIPEIK